MPYEIEKDPQKYTARDQAALAQKGVKVSGVSGADLAFDPYTRIEIVQSGTLQYLPAGNDDGAWIDIGSPAVGYLVKHKVRAVKNGSTAHFITLDY
jgi:hypothetical protein